MNDASLALLRPEWPAHRRVQAVFTLRTGGVSEGAFASFNLGTHVGDEPAAVAENRRRLRHALGTAEPCWLEQVHGTRVIDLGAEAHACPAADAVLARTAQQVCAVQVADCLPVLFAARDGSAVAAAHAGWRGLAAGVLESTVRALRLDPRQLCAWLGPAIGPKHFEVGEEVRTAFAAQDAGALEAFTANSRGRWQCDLFALARRRLAALGLNALYGGGDCTYADAARFFSYRRDGQCGRMAALVWLD
jgi:polyphenol oxidase